MRQSPLQGDSEQPLNPVDDLKETISINFEWNLKKYSEYYEYPSPKNFKFHAQSHEGILTAVFSQETQDPAFTVPDTILLCFLTKPE